MKKNWNKNMVIIVITCMTFIFISSCKKMPWTFRPVYYNISNETDDGLTVLYNYIPHNGGQEYDTIIRIEKRQKRTLLVKMNLSNKLGNPETEDKLKQISSIHIYNSDSIESQTDFMLTKYWTYIEYLTKSDLDLSINPEDF
ncbi:MAG: hypothetical protein KKB74_13800 [Bacteroidetes bacterium]|nr:hypothetical protein [Bacteroidota bacterium]